MKRNKDNISGPHRCEDFKLSIQEYLDGTLDKQDSLALFLHGRECPDCLARLDEVKAVFQLLDDLPTQQVPEDFNVKILAAVPYQAYREMEPLRRERVPVYLEHEYLPVAVRSMVTRGVGLAVALVCSAGLVTNILPDWTLACTTVGLLPEVIVRLQGLGRWLTLAVQKSES